MAPRKKAIPPKLNIRTDFLSSLPKKLPSNFSALNLNSEQLLRAYGLASPQVDSIESELLNRICPNKWIESKDKGKGKGKEVEVEVIKSKKEVEDDDVVIIADSEEEEEQDVVVAKSKFKPTTSKVSKAKAKAKDNSCSLENCSNNPRCLNWLGQDKWEDSDKAFEAMKRSSGLKGDPANPREPDTPVGLKNLGATCYANSLLQVWYQDVAFRAGVYACQPPANGSVQNSPLYQLQVLFSFLQSSKQAVYNPEPLVSSLKLDKGEQQDSQEFSKLFMSLLDHEFKKQGERNDAEGVHQGGVQVATLVADQFEGKVSYGTECNHCHVKSERHSTFLELEVVLKKDCKLEQQLKESLKPEVMDGDNKYYCDNCSQLRTATRSTTLSHLPPVLHVSLLRFVFSAKDYTRSKSTHSMYYPLKLNMGEFLPSREDDEDFGEKKEVWYDLRGVLMHKGTSAHHGHYVAQVRDASTDKWYLFDDESVTPIADLNAPDRYDEEEEVLAKRPKVTKEGFVRKANGEILPKSKDAYMLIYAKREPASTKSDQPSPPPLALQSVEDLDQVHDVAAGNYLDKEIVLKAEFKKLLEQKRSVYRNWDLMEDDEETYLVDKNELRKWVESDLPSVKPKVKKIPASTIVIDEDDELPDLTINGIKKKEAQIATNGDVEMEDPIVDGSISPTIIADSISRTTDDIDIDLTLITEDKLVKESESNHIIVNSSPLSSAKSREISPVLEVAQANDKVITNTRIVCSHGMANPSEAKDMKRIGQLGVMALKELGVEIEPFMSAKADLCRECVWGIASHDIYRKRHVVNIADIKAQEFNDGTVWISKAWYNDWMKETPSMHQQDTFDDPSPDSEAFKSDTICEHGKLQPNHKKRRLISDGAKDLFERIFPDWKWKAVINEKVSVCNRCELQHDYDKAEVEKDKGRITAEKKVLKSFDDQLRLIGNKTVIIPNHTNYIVPKEFATRWGKWSKGKGERPERLHNDQFLCQDHGRLIIDLKAELESPEEVRIVNAAEWKLLLKEYRADPEISVFLAHESVESYPAICRPCLDKKRKDFFTTNINIRSLKAEDFNEDGTRKPIDEDAAPLSPVMTRGGQKTYGSNAVRSSRRIQEKPAMMAAKASFAIEIEKTDSIRDLKVKIDTRMEIPTIYQRLFFNGREVENNETVEALNIYGGSTVELFEVKDLIDIDNLDDSVPDTIKTKKSRSREEGFGGTGLSGWENSEEKVEVEGNAVASGSGSNGSSKKKRKITTPIPERDERESSFPVLVNCPSCTYEQVIQEKCELCDVEMFPN